MNTPQLDTFTIELLQRYLQINTVHPDANYRDAIDLFISCAREDGFSYRSISLSSGLEVLVITYEGRRPDLPSIALHHHMDVVPAGDECHWKVPPFSGRIVDGMIVGRGAQDMKGVGVVQYAAIKTLKNQGIVPDRTIHLILVPDEERGGFGGMKLFAQTEFFKSLNIGFVFDEGYPSGDQTFLYYKVSERRVLQVKITVRGALAHGSQLLADNASHRLVQLLAYIVRAQTEAQLMAADTQPGMLTSYNITSLHAGIGQNQVLNIIPDSATATLDIRIAPHQSISEIKASLQDLCSQFSGATYDQLAVSHDEHEPVVPVPDALWYNHVSDVVQKYGIEIRPLHFEATTDLRYYHMFGIPGCGFTPFRAKPNLHGTNEAVSIDDLILGKNIMVEILKGATFYQEISC